MLSQNRIDKILATVRSICASPMVDQFLIGFTAQSASQRGDQYRNSAGFEHLVVLADKLSSADALDLEKRLQIAILENITDPAWEKYHSDKKENGQTYSSAGGKAHEVSDRSCAVYMAWWDRES